MKKGYIRFRCRPIPNGSALFYKLLNQINSLNTQEFDLLTDLFESEFIKALYYEKIGEMDLYIKSLFNLVVTEEYEIIRCIYLAIGYEKIGHFDQCKALLSSLKTKKMSEKLQLAIEFNYNVCKEKEGTDEQIDFTEFFKYKEIIFGNDVLANMALHMHLVVCDKTNLQFNYVDSLFDAFEFEKKSNYTNFLKIYYTFLKYMNQKLPIWKINQTINFIDTISLHSKAAILGIMIQLTDDIDTINLLQKKLKDLYDISKSNIVKSIIFKNQK